MKKNIFILGCFITIYNLCGCAKNESVELNNEVFIIEEKCEENLQIDDTAKDINNKEILLDNKDNVDNIDNKDNEINEIVSKIKMPQQLSSYKKNMSCYLTNKDNKYIIRDEYYNVDNTKKIIEMKNKNLINGNTNYYKYNLNNNTSEISYDNINWISFDKQYIEESNYLFNQINNYSIVELDDSFILTTTNWEYIKQNPLISSITSLNNPTLTMSNCYLSIIVDKNNYIIQDYEIFIDYKILIENKKENMLVYGKCSYYDIIN